MPCRKEFVLEWERRWDQAQGCRVDVAELCRRFGVSRQAMHFRLINLGLIAAP